MTSLARVQTRRFIFIAVLVSAAAGICNILDKLTWQHARSVSHVFDVVGFILFWPSYIFLWALLVLGPFRPETEFSLHGLCRHRAANFFLALGALVLLHIWAALAYAISRVTPIPNQPKRLTNLVSIGRSPDANAGWTIPVRRS